MFIMYIVITLLFGFACFVVGSMCVLNRNDGTIIIKGFDDDGSSVCNVSIKLTPEQVRSRDILVLRSIDLRDRCDL